MLCYVESKQTAESSEHVWKHALGIPCDTSGVTLMPVESGKSLWRRIVVNVSVLLC